MATMADRTKKYKVMRWSEILMRKAASRSQNGAWATWPEQMAMSKAISALAKGIGVKGFMDVLRMAEGDEYDTSDNINQDRPEADREHDQSQQVADQPENDLPF
jgi:recombinational DNA repair protein RecT